jgi:hypothetical protein
MPQLYEAHTKHAKRPKPHEVVAARDKGAFAFQSVLN